MADSNYNEPLFSDAELAPEERRRMRRLLWYSDRSEYLWSTIRRWAVIWAVIATAVVFARDGIKWALKALAS
jgi:hypothetical protein